MCGRYINGFDIDDVIARYGIEKLVLKDISWGDVHPSEQAPIVLNNNNDKRCLAKFKWGFTGFKNSRLIINARAETIDKKPMFIKSFKNRRCIIPASGFYEWKRVNGKNTKYRITMNDNSIFSMAGLYTSYNDDQGNRCFSYVIITTQPNPKVSSIHNRMPAILPKKEEEDEWLLRNHLGKFNIKQLLRPFDDRSRYLIVEEC